MRDQKIVPYALIACLLSSAITFSCAAIADSCHHRNCGNLFSQLPQLFTFAFAVGLVPGLLKFPFVSFALHLVEPRTRWYALSIGITALALPEFLVYFYALLLPLPFG